MASDWNTYKIKDIAKEMGDAPFGSNLKSVDYTETGALVVQGRNIQGLSFDWSSKRHVSIEKWASIPRSQCYAGDLIFPKVGTIGKVGILTPCNGYDKYLLSTNTMRLRVDEDIADQKYVYYYFSWNKTVCIINAMSSTSVQPVFNFTTLKNFNIELPSLSEQKAIAHILGSLDDKIELNRQMNETLEAMAQALFKSWFVDFDPVIDNALAAGNAIPDELLERAEQRKAIEKKDNSDINTLFPDEFEFIEEMGWIPKGWGVDSLLSQIELIGGGTPKTTVSEYWDGEIPWFSVVDAPSESDVFVIDTEKHVTQLGVEKSSTKILPVGTTIISARGTVGKCAMVSRPMAMNQSCYGIRGIDDTGDIFTYYSVLLNVSALQKRGHGSVFNTITKDTFKSINVAFGDKELTKKFEDLTKPYFDKILANGKQRIDLAKLRDTLLPKLMSGELRLDDL